MKEKLKTILLNETDASIRFELLEKFFSTINTQDDVRFLIRLLHSDKDPCVRHEVAAQLFRTEEKKPHLMENLRDDVIAALLERAQRDESTVVRHEAIEALGYIGDAQTLVVLKQLATEVDIDIRSTAEIAVSTTARRMRENVTTGELADHLVRNWRR